MFFLPTVRRHCAFLLSVLLIILSFVSIGCVGCTYVDVSLDLTDCKRCLGKVRRLGVVFMLVCFFTLTCCDCRVAFGRGLGSSGRELLWGRHF